MQRLIYQIAKEIRADWTKVNYGAEPYLEAMGSLNSINDKYYLDDAREIIMYFLANAQTWKGEKAREIKKELNQMLNN
jgi:hypothetical protein